MTKLDYTRDEEVGDVSQKRPHVLILGAGASLAAFPNGDANGRALPLMNNLVQVVGLTGLLDDAGIQYQGYNFEKLYAKVSSDSSHADLCISIENTVADYFAQLRLPESPTIYDYLVLSLRQKDVIATFNWDPFLYLALKRNRDLAPLPHWFYLHGCAMLGTCDSHKKQGELFSRCPTCDEPFKPMRLLYPVKDKDYTSDPYISSQWNSLKGALKAAFAVTIFGYSAPDSDAGAIELMKQGWGPRDDRKFEETELIDILDEELLRERWSPFTFPGHGHAVKDFFSSFIATHPRRTCEAYWQCNLEARFYEGNPTPRFDNMESLRKWFGELIKHENGSNA